VRPSRLDWLTDAGRTRVSWPVFGDCPPYRSTHRQARDGESCRVGLSLRAHGYLSRDRGAGVALVGPKLRPGLVWAPGSLPDTATTLGQKSSVPTTPPYGSEAG